MRKKKFWVKKMFGSKKKLRKQIFWVKKNFGSKKHPLVEKSGVKNQVGRLAQGCMIFKIRYTSLTGHFRACVVLIAFDPTGSEDLLLLQLDRSLPSYIGRTGAW